MIVPIGMMIVYVVRFVCALSSVLVLYLRLFIVISACFLLEYCECYDCLL